MPTYYDSQNNAHALAERIGSGGEGAVFFCEDKTLVAKIYHEPITEEKAEKLRWMAANKTERLLKTAAWVADVLTDMPNGRVVGFLMPNVKAKEIHELYSLKSRRVYFPEATWHFLVHTAANVARAFYNLHGAGHIMGDINQGNCVVAADGRVKLIDCDSYSVSTGTRRYRCEVGVATHLAPELQGVNLGDAERLPQHDNFGLAVIIFQLLFLGRHPFAGNVSGAQDKSLEECIREHRFAYGAGAKIKGIEQPPGTLRLSAASPRVAAMFERAFWTEDRPEPREWIEALEDLSRNLEQCAVHPGHLYFNGLAACPWCDIEAQTGLMLFPFVSADGERAFNIFTIENLIANLGIERGLAAAPPKLPAVLPPPASEIVEAKQESRKQMWGSIGVQLFVVISLTLVFGIGSAIFFGVCMLIFWQIFLNNQPKTLREEAKEKLAAAQDEWERFENEWRQSALSPRAANDLSQIKRRINDYQNLQQANARQAKTLRDEAVRRYLETARFADARIAGIREKQRQSLMENGFETAAEMDAARLRGVDGVGKRTIARLVEWRKSIEENFNAAGENTKPAQQATLAALESSGEQRRRIEREIEMLLGSLRGASIGIRQRQQQLFAKSASLAANLAQTKSDAAHLGIAAPTIVILIIITLLTPFFVGQITAPPAPPPPIAAKRESGVSVAPQPPLAKPSGEVSSSAPVNVPDETITDKQIEAMTENERDRIAEILYTQTLEFNYHKIDYAKAEKKIRFALRFNENDTRFLNELGYILYEQEEYTQSLYYLNRSLKYDANSGTKIFIAMNYLKTNRFKEARGLLEKVLENDSSSYEGYYNLGLADIGLKDYDAAIQDFNDALNLNPTDADSVYQLAVCLNKKGYKEAERSEYLRLMNIDARMAEKLKTEINLD